VPDRVEVGDPQGVGDHRTRTGAAPRSHPDVVGLRPGDEVGHHEEVGGETHLGDHPRLVVRAFPHLGGDAAGVPRREPAFHLLEEPGDLVLARRDGEHRHVVGTLRGGHEGDVALLGDEERVVAGLGQLAEQLPHLRPRAEIVGVAVELEAIRVGQGGAGLQAEQGGVGVDIAGRDVVGVVRGDEWRTELLRDAQQVGQDPPFDLQAVVHHLDVEVLAAEDVLKLPCRPQGLVVLTEAQPDLDLTGGAARRPDQPTGVLTEQFAVHPRPLPPLPLERRTGPEAHEVVEALVVTSPERGVGVGAPGGDVVVPLRGGPPGHPGPVPPGGPRGEVRLDPDDGLDAVLPGRAVEVVGPEQVPVVGDAEAGLPEVDGLLEERLELRGPVQHRVLGVDVEVCEGGGGHACQCRSRGRQTRIRRSMSWCQMPASR